MTMKRKLAAGILLFCILSSSWTEVLTWKSNAGQQYEVKQTVRESVIGLGSITNKPVEEILAAPLQEEAAERKSTLPHLQSILTFPKSSISPGDTWDAPASVSYDLSAFGIEEPLIISVQARYLLEGTEEIDGRTYQILNITWVPFHIMEGRASKRSFIERLSGYSTMTVYWDNRAGAPKKTLTTEEMQFRFTDGTSLVTRIVTGEEFRTVTDIVRQRIVSQLKEQIREQRVQNVEVSQTDEGIKLTIENIQFEPESAVLVEAEKAKLRNIGTIIAALKGQKLNIIGHAANVAGSVETELVTLSGNRAQSVANFLVESGYKTADEVVSSGAGGSQPIDTNETPEGRSRNRRVEIIIMDGEAEE